MKLIDTDVVIDHFHGHAQAMQFLADALAAGETVAISVVTIAEILSGMRPGEDARTESLLALFAVQDVIPAVARQAGTYLRHYRRTHRLELADALVAATAAHLGADLVTRNVKHYPMNDIRVVVPYERGS